MSHPSGTVRTWQKIASRTATELEAVAATTGHGIRDALQVTVADLDLTIRELRDAVFALQATR